MRRYSEKTVSSISQGEASEEPTLLASDFLDFYLPDCIESLLKPPDSSSILLWQSKQIWRSAPSPLFFLYSSLLFLVSPRRSCGGKETKIEKVLLLSDSVKAWALDRGHSYGLRSISFLFCDSLEASPQWMLTSYFLRWVMISPVLAIHIHAVFVSGSTPLTL